jgi:hypothetical protein
LHEITEVEAGRPDLVSWKLWGDWSLWPILMLFNGFADPINDFYAGRVIELPVDAISQTSDIIPWTWLGTS